MEASGLAQITLRLTISPQANANRADRPGAYEYFQKGEDAPTRCLCACSGGVFRFTMVTNTPAPLCVTPKNFANPRPLRLRRKNLVDERNMKHRYALTFLRRAAHRAWVCALWWARHGLLCVLICIWARQNGFARARRICAAPIPRQPIR